MRFLSYVSLAACCVACSTAPEVLPEPLDTPLLSPQGGSPGSACTGSDGSAGRVAADNSCCTEGCLDAQFSCHPVTRVDSLDYVTDPGMCGHHGSACNDCDDGNPCTDDVCAEIGCAHYHWNHTKACKVGSTPGFCDMPSGQCCTTNSAACCKGCLSAGACVSQCPGGQVCNTGTSQCVTP
jgi:hypothetical protein